ncbi:DUF6361 family protein [Isoptericola sp. NPDC057191]|uniref:DUF6361 family protein n=1 Tax=Isoptericola sp. NPDC057191 TaxID=3346041 RepID=UPI0036420401
MASTVAWLDTSEDEQRRIREVIQLFSQQESRDELGIGQIRDALSDLLFPGTSVLQTRARYFLIVPWSFQHAATTGSRRDIARRARDTERRLVGVLVQGNDDGVIGRRAGAAVKNLPSTLFWSGLQTFGILTHRVTPDQLTGTLLGISESDAADELVARQVGEWHPTIPPPPLGFPKTLDGGLNLTKDEARWLRERIVESARGTLLEHLVQADSPPDRSRAPWQDRVALSAPPAAREVLNLAHGFSLMMNGAALLYNLLVAERYVASGYTRVEDPVAAFHQQYADWLDDVHAHRDLLDDWDASAFGALVEGATGRVPVRAREFVVAWTTAVHNSAVDDAALNPAHPLRGLVAQRERTTKRGQSRLTNDKMLGAWNGASGTGPLTFRWSQVRGIITDIHEGLARDEEAVARA